MDTGTIYLEFMLKGYSQFIPWPLILSHSLPQRRGRHKLVLRDLFYWGSAGDFEFLMPGTVQAEDE